MAGKTFILRKEARRGEAGNRQADDDELKRGARQGPDKKIAPAGSMRRA